MPGANASDIHWRDGRRRPASVRNREQILPSLKDVRPESERIAFLLRRDGQDATRKWVARTAGLYREALAQPNHYAADAPYRPLFENAVRELEEWLSSAGL